MFSHLSKILKKVKRAATLNMAVYLKTIFLDLFKKKNYQNDTFWIKTKREILILEYGYF